jgi:subtilisin family serine protease
MRITIIFSLLFLCWSSLSAQNVQRYWIYFKDKGRAELGKSRDSKNLPLSDRSLQRRLNQGISPLFDYSDLPLESSYLQQLRNLGLPVYRQSKWLNAVSVTATAAELIGISNLPFVRKIEKVGVFHFRNQDLLTSFAPDTAARMQQNDYGPSENQNALIGIPQAHTLGYHGQGVRIALFDTGYSLLHESLQQVQVVASRDFVQGDSVVSNQSSDQPGQHNHGTEILAIIAGYKPGSIIGPAYSAEYLLAKTELINSETHLEEDNWVAAAEWADSLGADIISTSLGYSTFDAGQGDYTYADMDGNTTIITRAADLAASKGIAVFSSAGNEGASSWYYITAPADGDSVIAVGGVRPDGSHWPVSSNGPTADGRIKPDLLAQGQSVYSISPVSTAGYIYISGTSAACPLAAGAAAILLSIDSTLTVMQLYELLKSTASQAGNPDNTMGYGLINLEKCLVRLLDGKVLHLYNFTSAAAQGRNVLNWTAESILGVKEWIVQRQTGQSGFYELGRLEMPAGQMSPVNLSFTDLEINGGEFCRYRLLVELTADTTLVLDSLTVQSLSPVQTVICQNFPNPFNTSTQIIFSLDRPQRIGLKVYDRTGRLVRKLIDDSTLQASFHHYIWNGTRDNGSLAASGIYYMCIVKVNEI